METPSPQCVGREFVRQYYTLMNEAPGFLHRFYSTKSSFIHSGVDKPGQETEPVYGQKDIHKKIAELNFADCHTKIRQVDSQSTVGDGVVVQVTGELSNNGGPMRRFMQTFVLAHQNPKQYYVHNDIFRYQDEVFQEDESEDEGETHINNVVAGMENGVMNAEPKEQEPANEEIEEPTPQPLIHDSPVKPEARHVTPEPEKPMSPPKEKTPDVQEVSPEPVQQPPAPQPKTEKVESEMPPAEDVQDQPAKAPFSWAKLVKPASVAVVNPTIGTAPNTTKNAPVPLAMVSSHQKQEDQEIMTTSANSTSGPRDEQQPPTGGHHNRSNRSSVEPGSGFTKRPPSGFDDRVNRRNNENYPDNHQVFVGNLPVDINELGLRRYFNQYGKVIDIIINRGGQNKVPFGFVVFENDEPVKKLLQLQRVEMDGHRLNVEEKKARSERMGQGRRPPMRGNSRPKDRENSGSRSDNRPSTGGGRTFNAKR